MCEWSNNDRKYVVNESLRFALTQSEDFQKHKADLGTGSSQPNNDAKSDPPQPKSKPTRLRQRVQPRSQPPIASNSKEDGHATNRSGSQADTGTDPPIYAHANDLQAAKAAQAAEMSVFRK